MYLLSGWSWLTNSSLIFPNMFWILSTGETVSFIFLQSLHNIPSQTICWMGLFFAPLMSLITLIKLFCIFYIRLSYIKRLCKPANSRYEASRISSLLNTFLLVSFIFSLTPMAYIIGSMQPSNACGPFRSSNDVHYYTGVVWTLINVNYEWIIIIYKTLFKDWESGAGRSIFLTISKPSVLMSTSAGCFLNTLTLSSF